MDQFEQKEMNIYTFLCPNDICCSVVVDQRTNYGALIDCPNSNAIPPFLNKIHPIPFITKIFLTRNHIHQTLGVVGITTELEVCKYDALPETWIDSDV